LVIIAGKGSRPFQELGSAVIPWDDRLHARDALAGRGWVGDSL
jgi:UDP-N-acetylmuramyl tripeptide synthase